MTSIELDIIHLLTADIAWEYKIVPKQFKNNILTLFIDSSVHSNSLASELEIITGYNIELIKEEPETITQLLSKLYRKDAKSTSSRTIFTEINKTEDFLLKIIYEAKDLNSSDIHIEPYSEKCRIRLRIDGKLIERYRIPKDQYASFINKVKIKAGLDISEKRLPQDGRILISDKNNRIDIRVSVLPAMYGEKIVLRLLSAESGHIRLDNLGLDDKQFSDYQKILKKPHGIILISGPTGSGKTTTLYATLKLLNNEQNNILTIEDPIEYTLDGINQVQLKESIGLTFSNALKTFLRQDPDIIMLGEIRDGETAQMAIRAALTGHLVLSTIHTNSAWGTVSRLVDMGVPTFLLANTLNMTVAQRLVRKLCPNCKQPVQIKEHEYPGIHHLIDYHDRYYGATGCNKCYYSGYIGRIAIYEVIPVDNELAGLVKENSLNIDIYLEQKAISTLEKKAMDCLKAGKTSLEEIYPILLNH